MDPGCSARPGQTPRTLHGAKYGNALTRAFVNQPNAVTWAFANTKKFLAPSPTVPFLRLYGPIYSIFSDPRK